VGGQWLASALALAPILLIIILMLGLRWGAVGAGLAGYLLSLAIAVVSFGARANLLWVAHIRALLLALDVLLIIWAAFLLYRVADEAGAIAAIGQALPHLTGDRHMQALVIGWVFASFLQGVGGFGVPVAVVSPLLVGLGFTPLAAVVIPSLGSGWAVTFGSLGSSFQALLAATGLPASQLAPPAAWILGLAGLLVGWLTAHATGGWRAAWRLSLPVLVLGVGMGAAQYLAAVSGFWNLGAFTGGAVGLALAYPLARWRRGQPGENGRLDVQRLLVALAGYAALVGIILAVQFIPALRVFLGQGSLHFAFPETRTLLGYLTPAGERSLVPFRHPGTLLFYAAISATLVYGRAGFYQTGALRRILAGTLSRVAQPSLSILAMVSMSVVMEHAGMTQALAIGLAQGFGNWFPLVSPWIGGLGAFITGSNTNSNVMFGALQLQTTRLLGLPAAVILAGQTAGASLASVLAPAKLAVGASTAGMAGQEGLVMRRLAGYTAVLLLFVGVWVWWR
jgi:lactate permease